jgi:hypothetical protein
MNQWVILSSNLDLKYAFLLPITAKTWERLGYKSVFMLVGDETEWNNGPFEVVLSELKKLVLNGHKLIFVKQLEGYSVWTTANIIRLYAGCMAIDPEDYAIIGDSDLFVLKSEFILQRDKNKSVNLWYANAFNHTAIPQYPMCHVGSSIKVWREIMNIKESDIYTTTLEKMDKAVGRGNDTDTAFNEKFYATTLRNWSGFPHQCQFITRPEWKPEHPSDRLDRGNWDLSLWGENTVDAHLPRPALQYWDTISVILDKICPEHREWFATYKNKF